MKISTPILATMALLAMAAFSVPGALAEQSIVTSITDSSLHASQPVDVEKASWAPVRALKVKDLPQQQGKHDNGNPQHHHQHPNKNAAKQGHHRALGQGPVATPASTTTSNTNVTPAPTKPKPTPAATTTKATPAPTKPKTVAPCHTTPKPKATPASTKSTPTPTNVKPNVTPCPTKPTPTATKPNTATSTSSDVQQKTRNLRDGQAKHQ
ncbi:hypothetical protein F444_20344 [Phytophthora nicotianae P1976]|uniref:RxLR effector protein n=2 Tax=Phytophthora nicotianae TaxID=4792 RepID=A0A080Z4Y0_PHYNI|nr:hypothetical protein F444_20344 [Phytophthora nicotianae P1976]